MIDNPFDIRRDVMQWAISLALAVVAAGVGVMMHAPKRVAATPTFHTEWHTLFPDATLTPSGNVCVVRDTPEAIWEWVFQHPRHIRRIETQADEQGYRTELTWATP